MKLTISKKNQIKNNPPLLSVNQVTNSKISQSPCCDLERKKQTHKFFRPPNKEEKLLYDLIKIDSLCLYSKVSTIVKSQDLLYTILQTLYRFKVRYQPWIGYLCAHSCHNLPIFGQRMDKIGQFVQKFRSAFQQQRCYKSVLQQTLLRLNKYCEDSKLKPTQNSLLSIAKKFQQTLLLQFLPVEYSQYIIGRYLSIDGDIQQYVRLATSLVHCVLNTSNPINEVHFVEIMFRPFMGTIQWPIVIANRHIFQAEIYNSTYDAT